MSMGTPYAASAVGAVPVLEQPQASVTTRTIATVRAAARRARPALRLRAGPCNVQHNLELEQRCAGGHGVVPLTGVCLYGRTGRPRLERLFGLPLRDDEVAVFALDWA